MTIAPQLANVGLANNDHNGDPLRIAMQKYNQNFTDIYTAIQPNASIKTITVNTGITVGNASVYATVNSTLYTGTSNNSLYLGGNAAVKYIQNTDSRVLSGNLSFTASNVNFTSIQVGSNIFTSNSFGVYANSLVSAYALNVTDTANVTTLNVANNARIVGNLEVDGALLIAGNTTFINASVITTNDKYIWLSNNATTNVNASGSGIVIGQNANLVFNGTAGAWQANVNFIPAVNNLSLGTSSYQWNLIANNANANYIFASTKVQIGNAAGFDFGSNAVIEIDQNANSYIQVVIQNANSGINASGDLVITTDTGNDSVNYVDFGINSSTYSNATYGLTGPLDAYLYSSDSQLVLGTASVEDVVIHAGGVAATNRVLTVNTSAVTVANGQTLAANVINTSKLVTNIANASNVIATNIIASYINAAASVNAVTINATSVNASSFTTSNNIVNVTVNTSSYSVGNSVANTIITANGITIAANGQGYFRMGNTAVNTTVNATAVYVANSTGNSLLNPSGIYTTGTINAASYTVGTNFIANTTGAYHTGTVNAASHTVGTSFIANSTAIVGTGYANVTTSVNSASLTVGTNFIANSTAIVGTGYANVTTSVNSASLTVGTNFIANTTGAYHTGTVNAASHTVGTSFIANSSVLTFTPNTFNLGTSTTTANGYTYLPNGLKMNYGFVAANSTVGNVTFTNAYTTNAYVVMLTSANTVAAANVPYISSQNNTVAVIRSASVAAATTIYYLAIGI